MRICIRIQIYIWIRIPIPNSRYRSEDPQLHPDPYQMSRIRNTAYSCKLLINKIEDAPYIISSFNWRRLSLPFEILWVLPIWTWRLCSTVSRFHKTVAVLSRKGDGLYEYWLQILCLHSEYRCYCIFARKIKLVLKIIKALFHIQLKSSSQISEFSNIFKYLFQIQSLHLPISF